MAYLTNNLKVSFNTIHAVNHINNYNISRNKINNDEYNNTNSTPHKNSVNKTSQNYILLPNPNPMCHKKNISSRVIQISLSENKIQKSLPCNKENDKNKKYTKIDNNIYDTKNTLLESIKESNCDSTTINNNDTNSDEYNYNDLLKELNNISENKKNSIKKTKQKHAKHYSDFTNTKNVLKTNKKNKSNNKNTKNYDSNKNNNNKKYLNNENNNKNNLSLVKSKTGIKKINVNNIFDRNNILNEIGNYELYILNNINNICYNNEQDDALLDSKLNKYVLEQLENKNDNKQKKPYKKESTFINNFNSDYSFESDDCKKNFIGSKINNYPISNNLFKDISFRTLTNSSESKIEVPENINKKKKSKTKITNNLILNNDNNNLNEQYFKIKYYNLAQDLSPNFNINKFNNNDYSELKKNIKRNISENILKNNQKKNDKKYIENKIYTILNNKKNNNNQNSSNKKNNNSKEKKKEFKSNESWYKINKNNIFNKKRLCYTNNGKIIKKSKLKISINDNNSNKIKEKKIKKKTLSNLSIDKIVDNNLENKRKNIKFFVSNNSINYTKHTIDKSNKKNLSSSIRQSKLKSKSTPKKISNFLPFNNSNINNKIKNKNVFDNSLTSLPKKTVNSYSHKNKTADKSFKKISKKLFVPKIFININKNNNKRITNRKIKHKKKLNVKNYLNLENLFFKDYIYKCNINSFINNNKNNSIINLKSNLYNTISKTKSNSISMKKTKIIYNKFSNTKRNFKNESIYTKKNIKTNMVCDKDKNTINIKNKVNKNYII